MAGFYILIFILGISFGSFLNALEWRLNKGMSLVKGNSKCPKCNRQIKWYDNIPLVSFFVLKSKCRTCKENISWQYPIVEFWMGIVFLFVSYYHGIYENVLFGNADMLPFIDYIIFIKDLVVVWVLTFIFVYDLKYMEVSDLVTLGGAAIVFIISLVTGGDWFSLLLGAVIGASFFLIQFVISKGRWVGGGDIRIGLLMGAILGWKLLLLALWVAYVIGAIIGVALLVLRKKKMKSPVPFGVFLTFATFIVMFWGQKILDWYVNIIS
ncbi:hypothetical protein C0581_00735 [Candidatus Parcubacteria bacterium]|nr:MAG: hypothetical protein C0581_00735 [Candidatus Parcubacteria bacterium]